MTVTPDTVVVGVEPDITSKKFEEVLQAAESPAEPWSRSGYKEIVDNKVSPAFALAIFKHESRFGHEGLVPLHNLRNPGATRTTRTGEGTVVQIPGRGNFVKYPTWTQGWDDLAFRLIDPEFEYAVRGARTIREIIPIWAPSSDGNAPESYIAAVVRSMNEWIEEQPVAAQIQIPGVEIEWVPADDRHYTKGRTASVKQIVHHHTDGWDSLAWLTTSPGSNVSAHFLVNHEGTKIWQLVRLEDTAHTQGNHNPWSFGIEWERKWPDQENVPEQVYDTLAKLDIEIIRYVNSNDIGDLGRSREYIKRHDEVNDTGCPMNLDVDRIVWLVNKPDDVIEFPNGFKLQHGFADFYRSLGDRAWAAVGVPIENELAEVINGEGIVTVQRTDVGYLQWNPATDEIRMATREQQRAIEKDLGISKEIDVGRYRQIGEQLIAFGNELRN